MKTMKMSYKTDVISPAQQPMDACGMFEEKQVRELQYVAKWMQKQQRKALNEYKKGRMKVSKKHNEVMLCNNTSTVVDQHVSIVLETTPPSPIPEKSIFESATVVIYAKKSLKSKKKSVRTHFKKRGVEQSQQQRETTPEKILLQHRVIELLTTLFPRCDVMKEYNQQLLKSNCSRHQLNFAAMHQCLMSYFDDACDAIMISSSLVYRMIQDLKQSKFSNAIIDLLGGVFKTHAELQIHVLQGIVSRTWDVWYEREKDKSVSIEPLLQLYSKIVRNSPYAMLDEVLLATSLGRVLETLLELYSSSVEEEEDRKVSLDDVYVLDVVFSFWLRFPEHATNWIQRYFKSWKKKSASARILGLRLLHCMLGNYRKLPVSRDVLQIIVRSVVLQSIAAEHLVICRNALMLCCDPVVQQFFWVCDSVVIEGVNKVVYKTSSSHWDVNVRNLAEEVFESLLDFSC